MEIRSMALGELRGHEAGQILLEEMYRQIYNRPMPAVFRTERGKPVFAGGDVHFSISHTPRRVFCVLADRPVGVDAEETDRGVNLKLAEKILSSGEYAQFQQAKDKRQALLKFWVLKEAAAKCTGEGLKGYPNQTAFSLEDPRVQIVDNCYVAIIEE